MLNLEDSTLLVAKRDLINPGFCIGQSERDVCDPGLEAEGCVSTYGWDSAWTDRSGTYWDNGSGDMTPVNRGNSLCGQNISGTEVVCASGADISKECSDYGVARYGFIGCRTVCSTKGGGACWETYSGYIDCAINPIFVCDLAF